MLLTPTQYQERYKISRATYYNWRSETKIEEIEVNNVRYCYDPDKSRFTQEEKDLILESREQIWKAELKKAHLIYKRNTGACAETRKVIDEIMNDAEHYAKMLSMKIRGYDRRSLQLKIKDGCIERKPRSDKFGIRNKVLKGNPEVMRKALDLTSTFFQDSLGNINLAIDKAIHFAKSHEEYYEVAAVNIHTLRRHVRQVAKQSGYRTVHEYLNHYNNFRSKLAFTKGSFTEDIEFGDVYSMDDHKFDIAGVRVWNEERSEFQQKQLYSWVIVEMKTMYPLAWEIKASPFNEEDLIRLMMRCIREHGLPAVKFICDQGLGKSTRVKEFAERLGMILEPQDPYSPTQKANNERIFAMVKAEEDVYNENFTGSNHPVEGRHRGLKLSPEETTEIENEAIARYHKYFTGFFLERPRKREIKGIEHLCDNTGRVSIKNLYEYYYQKHTPVKVTDLKLRYAYLKYDKIKAFENFYIVFKKEMYLPVADTELSLVLHDKSYKYTIAYDPSDLNTIDLYSCQDIMDRISGDMIAKGQYVATLESLANLPVDEKKRRVAMYNKKINRIIKELAVNLRSKTAVEKDLINSGIGDTGVVSVIKEQERAVEKMIKNSLPIEKIENSINSLEHTKFDIDQAMSDEAIDELNNL